MSTRGLHPRPDLVLTSPQSCSCSCCRRLTPCWPACSWLSHPADTPPPCPSPRSSGCCSQPYPTSYTQTLLWETQVRACERQGPPHVSSYEAFHAHGLPGPGFSEASRLITKAEVCLQAIPCKSVFRGDLINIPLVALKVLMY